MEWLNNNLEEWVPTIIFSHHPFVKSDLLAFSTGHWDYEQGLYIPGEFDKIERIIQESNSEVLANFGGHIHGFYPLFINANVDYSDPNADIPPLTSQGTPNGIHVVTTEALMVASNEPIPKGIIRIVKIKGDEITIPFKVEGEFRALNPYLKIDEERLRFGEITVEFGAYAFTKRFTPECPGRYAIDYGDGTEIEWSKEITEWYKGPIFKQDYEGGKEYDVTLFATGWTPEGEPIIEKIEQRIRVSRSFDLGIIGLSPIDLIVTDPDGFTISKEINEIPGVIYTEEVDFNGDGELDDIIAIPNCKLGDYIIDVISDATTTDTYSLLIWPGTMSVPIVLVDEVQVVNIPDQPYIISSTETEVIPIIPATIDFDPYTLNLKSKGKWVTVYIELPEGHGYDVSAINLGSIVLNSQIPAEIKPTDFGDHDNDGIPDLMVKFDRQAVQDSVTLGFVEMKIRGSLIDGVDFQGIYTVLVISGHKR